MRLALRFGGGSIALSLRGQFRLPGRFVGLALGRGCGFFFSQPGCLSGRFSCGFGRRGLLFCTKNGVQFCVHTVEPCLRLSVAWHELQGFLVFVSCIFPPATSLRALGILHRIVVPHPGALHVFHGVRQPVQFIVNPSPHLVGVVQIKLDPPVSFVVRRYANGGVRDVCVKSLNGVEQRHVQIEHESIFQLSLRRGRTVDGHPLGNHPVRTENQGVVASHRQIEVVLAVAVHIDFIEGLAELKNRHGHVGEPLFGFLVFQGSAHHQRLILSPRSAPDHHHKGGSEQATKETSAIQKMCRVGLHHVRSAEK